MSGDEVSSGVTEAEVSLALLRGQTLSDEQLTFLALGEHDVPLAGLPELQDLRDPARWETRAAHWLITLPQTRSEQVAGVIALHRSYERLARQRRRGPVPITDTQLQLLNWSDGLNPTRHDQLLRDLQQLRLTTDELDTVLRIGRAAHERQRTPLAARGTTERGWQELQRAQAATHVHPNLGSLCDTSAPMSQALKTALRRWSASARRRGHQAGLPGAPITEETARDAQQTFTLMDSLQADPSPAEGDFLTAALHVRVPLPEWTDEPAQLLLQVWTLTRLSAFWTDLDAEFYSDEVTLARQLLRWPGPWDESLTALVAWRDQACPPDPHWTED